MARHTGHLGALLIAVAFVVGCPGCPPPPPDPPPPPPPSDGGGPPVPTEGEPCERACERMRQLGCPEAEPNPAGDACEVWLCAQAGSTIVDHDFECLARIESCADVDGRCRGE